MAARIEPYFDFIERLIAVATRPPQSRVVDGHFDGHGEIAVFGAQREPRSLRLLAIGIEEPNAHHGLGGAADPLDPRRHLATFQTLTQRGADHPIADFPCIDGFQDNVAEHPDAGEAGIGSQISTMVVGGTQDGPRRIASHFLQGNPLPIFLCEDRVKMQRQRVPRREKSSQVHSQFAIHVLAGSDPGAVEIHIDNGVQALEPQEPSPAGRSGIVDIETRRADPVLLGHPLAFGGAPGQPRLFDRAMHEQHIVNHRRHIGRVQPSGARLRQNA
ncbi:MAG: hypothetical protein NTW86_05620 [Candidatus Sumerlaeota bacterium]|nr:hypothetical protein [Candidatus Sumerlaeota bacterium]